MDRLIEPELVRQRPLHERRNDKTKETITR